MNEGCHPAVAATVLVHVRQVRAVGDVLKVGVVDGLVALLCLRL